MSSYHDACMCFVVIWRMHVLKSLLTSSVPEICRSKRKEEKKHLWFRFYKLFLTGYKYSMFVSRKSGHSKCTVLTNCYGLASYSGCVFVEGQGIGWQLLGSTAWGVKGLNNMNLARLNNCRSSQPRLLNFVSKLLSLSCASHILILASSPYHLQLCLCFC